MRDLSPAAGMPDRVDQVESKRLNFRKDHD
jgi:hypothetical protein